jgi:hypothetical protein
MHDPEPTVTQQARAFGLHTLTPQQTMVCPRSHVAPLEAHVGRTPQTPPAQESPAQQSLS